MMPDDIITGDSFDVLPEMESESAHAAVTDPPYGLAFMGRDWDDFEPREYQEWCEEWATLALEVLKPGGHLLAFSGNRTHHRLFSGVEDAGFEIRDTLTWHYGQGFPKSLDVSKEIDKQAGAERKVVGKYDSKVPQQSPRQSDGVVEGEGTFDRHQKSADITAPATDAAREWDGWKTQLKPATEYIVLARKPFEGTVVGNVQEHGTGALNIEPNRTPLNDGEEVSVGYHEPEMNEGWKRDWMNDEQAWDDYKSEKVDKTNEDGRYPANVIFDETAAEMMDQVVGEQPASGRYPGKDRGPSDDDLYGDSRPGGSGDSDMLDGGGPSRYFFVHGWDDFATEANLRFHYASKATKAERTLDGRIDNAHPTVKPQDLMEWLVKLVTKEEQVVLDPFAGSGTTAAACKDLNRRFLAVEKDEKWADVARIRTNLTPEDPSAARADADAQHGLEAFTDDD